MNGVPVVAAGMEETLGSDLRFVTRGQDTAAIPGWPALRPRRACYMPEKKKVRLLW